MNQENLTRIIGYNTDSGLLYKTQMGLPQFQPKANLIPRPVRFDMPTYKNMKNEAELLDSMNSITEPDYYEGKKKELRKIPVYMPPPNEPILGGSTQEQLNAKLK
jgi:hypothetical protein